MTCQAHRLPASALDADERGILLLATARMQECISDNCELVGQTIEYMKRQWGDLNKPASEIAELQTMLNWGQTVRDRLLAMADECDKEMRVKMKALINDNMEIATEHEPVCKHCGETRQIVKANITPGDWILCRSCYHHTRLDQDAETVPASQLNEPVVPTSKQCRYILDSDPDEGEYRVMKIMAICDDYEIARSICNMFNEKDQ